MRVLVTGCAGFIGSHCCERLLARGDEVVGLDNFDPYYDRALKERNLAVIDAAATRRGQWAFVSGDLLNDADLARAFALGPFDRVLHLAAKVGVRPSVQTPAAYMRTNVEGTTRLLQAMSAHGCTHLVYASSSSVYGNLADAPFAEDARVDAPVSPYAASKRAGELICRAWHDLTGMHTYGLRLFTVYGPRQRPEMAFQVFAAAALAGRSIAMFGDGTSSRTYTYVDDVATAALSALDRVTGCELINVGGEREISLREVISVLGEALGAALPAPIAITEGPSVAGDVRRTCADLTKARALLGYSPRVSLEAGLSAFAAWLAASQSPD